MEDILKQSGWGNSTPNPTSDKQMHIFFFRNYIFFKSDIPLNRYVMLLQSTLLFFLLEAVSYSNSTTNMVISYREFLKN